MTIVLAIAFLSTGLQVVHADDGEYGHLPEGTILIEDPSSGELIPIPGTGRTERGLTDATRIAFCKVPGASGRIIDKCMSKRHGTIKFECGWHNDKSGKGHGFKHIIAGHPESEWRSQMGGRGPWTGWMKYLIQVTLQGPSIVTNKPDSKACYQAPVKVYKHINGKPRYWKTINPKIIVSKNNKRIITAFPSTKSRCS